MLAREPGRPTAAEFGEELNGGVVHPSSSVLFTAVLDLFKSRGFHEKVALTSTYFVFSTLFSACLPVAPCLLITGARPEARLLLELFQCLVSNPLPLFELTRREFLSIDINLEPTVLIDDDGISASMWKLLRASNHRNARVLSSTGMQTVYCSKVIYVGTDANVGDIDDSLLRINLSPLLYRRLPILEESDKLGIAAQFEPRLRAYRQRNFARVRDSRFDLPEFASAIRILARVLGAPIVDAPELQAALGPMLREYQEAIGASLWLDPRCVAIEAVLFRSHDCQTERLHVGEITRNANAILKGRGETTPLEAKAVGAILRQLGLSPRRDRNGYAIHLDDSVRRCIHQLASRFRVATVQQGEMLCAHCAEFFAFEPGNEGPMLSMK
jgi:hypothetical protein